MNSSHEGSLQFEDVFLSILLHCFLLGCFFLLSRAVNFSSKSPSLNIDIISSSVRVDVVAMPEQTLKELKTISMEELKKAAPEPIVKKRAEPKPIIDNSKAVEFKKKKAKKMSFLDKLKLEAGKKVDTKIKGRNKIEKTRNSIDSKTQNELRKLVLAGNKVKEGNAITGDGQSAETKEKIAIYASDISRLVKPNWRLPSYLAEKDLRARVKIYVSSTGSLIKAEIFESSGVPEFDERALAAVKASSPFPTPNGSIFKSLARGEILLGFPL